MPKRPCTLKEEEEEEEKLGGGGGGGVGVCMNFLFLVLYQTIKGFCFKMKSIMTI